MHAFTALQDKLNRLAWVPLKLMIEAKDYVVCSRLDKLSIILPPEILKLKIELGTNQLRKQYTAIILASPWSKWFRVHIYSQK